MCTAPEAASADCFQGARSKKGRRNKRLLRLGRSDLRAFVHAVITWFELAPAQSHDWYARRVELKQYFPDRPPRWLKPSARAKDFVAQSGCPLEVLAVVAWDIIKTLPVHTHRPHRGSKVYPLLQSIRAGRTTARDLLRQGNAVLEDSLAKSWGYFGKDDARLPFQSKQRSSQGERVLSGERIKSPSERRKSLGADVRKRWPQPSGSLLEMSSPMRSYWRRHAQYRSAFEAFKNELRVYRDLKSQPDRRPDDD